MEGGWRGDGSTVIACWLCHAWVVGNTGRARRYVIDRADEGWEKAAPMSGLVCLFAVCLPQHAVDPQITWYRSCSGWLSPRTNCSSMQQSFNKRGFFSFSVIELNNCSALKWLISSHSCLALAHQRGSRCPSSVPAHSLLMSLTSLLELISLLLSQQGTNFLLSTKDVITFSYVY